MEKRSFAKGNYSTGTKLDSITRCSHKRARLKK